MLGKGKPFFSKNGVNRDANKRRRETEAAEAEARDAEGKVTQLQALDGKPKETFYLAGKNGSKSHNCSHKDAAKTHPFGWKCLQDRHMAGCRNCNNIVSVLYGCSRCKKNGLDHKNLVYGDEANLIVGKEDCGSSNKRSARK